MDYQHTRSTPTRHGSGQLSKGNTKSVTTYLSDFVFFPLLAAFLSSPDFPPIRFRIPTNTARQPLKTAVSPDGTSAVFPSSHGVPAAKVTTSVLPHRTITSVLPHYKCSSVHSYRCSPEVLLLQPNPVLCAVPALKQTNHNRVVTVVLIISSDAKTWYLLKLLMMSSDPRSRDSR